MIIRRLRKLRRFTLAGCDSNSFGKEICDLRSNDESPCNLSKVLTDIVREADEMKIAQHFSAGKADDSFS